MAEKLVIIGGGESGVGSALLAKQKAFDVFVSDIGKLKTNFAKELNEQGIAFEEGQHSYPIIRQADLVIKSPGIPDDAPVIQKLKAENKKIISELDWAFNHATGKLIGITGSNGKTTTTLLLDHLMKDGGMKSIACGNIGYSFSRAVATQNFDHYILEISSFQLDDSREIELDMAILLNISPDHLDRYQYHYETYAQSKFSIIDRLKSNCPLIFNADDSLLNTAFTKHQGSSYCFSIEKPDATAMLRDKELHINIHQKSFHMSIDQLALQGRHNLYNSMAASIAAKLFDIRNESIKKSLSDFQNVAHRLEQVAVVHGVQYINDSKATNVNSSWFALESIHHKVVWIAGGLDKGNNYQSIKPLVKEKVKAIICLGLDNSKIKKAFADDAPAIYETDHMQQAVQMAYRLARKGDTVLLSPACASFDLFENYEDRGNQFKSAVKAL